MNIKNLLFVIIIISFFYACTTEDKQSGPFTITGNIDGKTYGTVSLGHFDKGNFVTDHSIEFIDGKFEINGKVDFPYLYFFKIQGLDDYKSVFIEPAIINIDVVIDSSEISSFDVVGSATNDLYGHYVETNQGFNDKNREIYNNYYKRGKEEDNEVLLATADSLYDVVDKAQKLFITSFAIKNKDNVVGPYIIFRNSYYYDLPELDSIVSFFEERIASSEYMKKLNGRLAILKRVDIGQPIVDFSMNDTSGNPVLLSSLIGDKYLLIDFWASWCGPCRAENPNIVAVFKEYSDRGFDILGVSLDTGKENWIEAIHDDELTWHHVSDLAGWRNEAAGLYGIRSIPKNVLVDRDGIIIAKNLNGEDLENKISELLDQ